ncbi:S100 calcium binding protein W [Lepisosteus oculatus]|uniref:S100 calcium binding protein W n=1 Tax=Lepisosteus oculatus TaxID=7918 RepID=UPI0003EAC73C|nr:PREDICTED: protein S100-A1-like [Lepisosteus oculatus]XP_015191952.1 PREDICTED: protein S100-A1-like [Lepisosteus oculatus]
MSKLEVAVRSLVELFEHYASQDEHKCQLSSAELKQLLQAELTSPEFKTKFDPADIEEVMAKLDKNHDGEVNFHEFCKFVGMLAQGYYRCQKGKAKK